MPCTPNDIVMTIMSETEVSFIKWFRRLGNVATAAVCVRPHTSAVSLARPGE